MIDGFTIPFVNSAEHFGVVRIIDGNLPHIQNCNNAHMRALFSVLPAGLARIQKANLAVSLQSVYALPVLLSGNASLNLLESDICP